MARPITRSHQIDQQYSVALTTLSDVDVASRADGDALVWDESLGLWVAGDIGLTLLTEDIINNRVTITGELLVTGGGGFIQSEGITPTLALYETGAAADEARWRLYADNGSLFLQSVNDAYTASDSIFGVSRTGLGIDEFQLYQPTLHESFLYWRSGGDATNLLIFRAAAENYQIRTNDDGAGNQLDATKASWAMAIYEGPGSDAFGLYRRPAGGAFALLWKINALGTLYPGADDTYDIGSAAFSVRDFYLQGETVGENGNNVNAANQALFGQILTDIVGTSWAVGANEVWDFDIHIPYLRDADPGTVGWTINGPAGSTVAYTVHGQTTSSAFATVYSTSLNTGAGSFGTATSTQHFVTIRGRIATAGTAGTAVARGITSGAATGCTPLLGAHVSARRVS